MTDPKQADLVFEGGGVKGIAFGGALAALDDAGYEIKRVAGTSAGAITAALVAAGYTASELDALLQDMPFEDFKDESTLDKFPGGKLLSVIREFGVYEGKFFRDWITGLLADKGVAKFGDLLNPGAEDPNDPDQRWRLQVIASDVTDKRMLVLPRDAKSLGVEPDELDVGYAVRMSMSIPIFFEPVVHEHDKRDTVIVDGGLLSNFPVWLFDRKGGKPPRWPTFGLLLAEPDPEEEIGKRLDNEDEIADKGSLVDFVKNLALTALAAHDRLYVDTATYARTIPIPTLGVGTTEFSISEDRVKALRQSGHDAVEQFLSSWNWDDYLAHIRDQSHSRREMLDRMLR
jgi:NTE family protein